MGIIHPKTSESGNETYDVLAALLRHKLRELSLFDDHIIDNLLPVNLKNFENQPLIGAVNELATVMTSACYTHLVYINKERFKEIAILKDVQNTIDEQVSDVFNNLMHSWLGSNKSNMSWEKIIMILHFTQVMIINTVKANGYAAKRRLCTLVDACVNYINTYVLEWINQSGGWLKIADNFKDILFKREYDVPATSIPGCPRRVSIGGTVYEDGPPHNPPTAEAGSSLAVDAGASSAAGAGVAQCSDPTNYDITVAYIKKNLFNHDQKDWRLLEIIPEINIRLQPKRHEMDWTAIVDRLLDIAKVLLPMVSDKYDNVFKMWEQEVDRMLDLRLLKYNVWQLYDMMMYTWLKGDGKQMTWERIIVLLEFTTDMIFQLAIQKEEGYLERISDVAEICSEFLNQYAYDWIKQMGQWGKILSSSWYITPHNVPNEAKLTKSIADQFRLQPQCAAKSKALCELSKVQEQYAIFTPPGSTPIYAHNFQKIRERTARARLRKKYISNTIEERKNAYIRFQEQYGDFKPSQPDVTDQYGIWLSFYDLNYDTQDHEVF